MDYDIPNKLRYKRYLKSLSKRSTANSIHFLKTFVLRKSYNMKNDRISHTGGNVLH